MPGFGATMLGDLDSGLGVAVAVNATDERDLTEDVAAAILDLQRDRAEPRVADPLAVAEAAELRGRLHRRRRQVPIAAEGDRLLLDGQPLEPRGSDRFLADRADLSALPARLPARGGPGRRAPCTAETSTGARGARPNVPAPPPEWSA